MKLRMPDSGHSIHPHLNPLPSRERKRNLFPHGSRPGIGVRGMPSPIAGLLRFLAQTARTRWAEDENGTTGEFFPSSGNLTPPHPFWIPAFAGMTNSVAADNYFRTNRPCRRAPAHQGMKMRPGHWRCLGVVGATLPLWIPASARMTNSVAADNYFRTNRPCRRAPAHEGMKMKPSRWKCLGVVGATLPLWIPASARMTNSVAADNYFRTNRPCRLVPAHEGMKMRPGRWKCLGVVGATLPLWIPASARMTNSVAADNYFRTNRPCRWRAPAHQGMKMRPGRWRCLGVVGATLPLWIPASARMTNSVAADNYFRTNRPCRLPPAHQGMKMRPGRWRCLGVVGATLPLWIPAFAGMTNSVAADNYFRTNRPCRRAPGHQVMKLRMPGAFYSPSPQSSPIKGEEEEPFPHGSRPRIWVRGMPSPIAGLLKCVAQTARTRWAEDEPPRYINQSLQSSGS